MNCRSSRARHACAALLVLWAVVPRAAECATSTDESLTLARAIELAATHGPAGAAMIAESESLAISSEANALPPAMLLGSEFENFAGSGAASGTDLLESTLRVTRVFELGDKASLRRRVGAAARESLDADHRLRRNEQAAEVARRFIHVLSDQAMLASARRATELARTASDVAAERVKAGASSPAAHGRAQIAFARAQIAQEHAEHELAASRVKLAVLWGDTAASFAQAQGDLFALAELDPFEVYRDRLQGSPELAKFATQALAQDARIRLAQAQRSPDLSISAGMRRLESLDDQALVASFSVPLGTRRRAELQERAARADRKRIDMDWQAQRLQLHAELFGLYQEIVHARTEAVALQEQVRPQAQAMLATTDQGYRAGRFSLLELADAQLQLIEVEREAIRAAAQFHTLAIEMQRAIGEPIRMLASGSAP